jgi:phosphate uptake regulator
MNRRTSDPIERNVQIAGGTTFTLSLPREWGDRHDLSKGDTLYLYTDSDRLIVAPSTVDREPNAARIDTADVSEEGVAQNVKAAYTAGCEQITVAGDGPLNTDLVRTVTETVENLVGMEIQERTEREILIQDHLDPNAVSLDQSIVQMRQLAVGMQDDAVEAVRMNDEALARLVRERDTYVDRLFAFVSRGFHRGLEDVNELNRLDVTRKTAFHYYKIARELERVADRAERIADVADAQSTRPDEALGERFKELVSGATDVVTLALNDDTDGAIDAYRTVVERLDAVDDELSVRDGPDAYRYGTDLVESARQTSACGLNIVNMTVEISVIDMLYSADGHDFDVSPSQPRHR